MRLAAPSACATTPVTYATGASSVPKAATALSMLASAPGSVVVCAAMSPLASATLSPT